MKIVIGKANVLQDQEGGLEWEEWETDSDIQDSHWWGGNFYIWTEEEDFSIIQWPTLEINFINKIYCWEWLDLLFNIQF